MKLLFISQPMNGKGDQEILDERADAIKQAQELVGEEVEVLETFYDDFGPDAKPLEFLARSIADLAKADVAFFAKGWDKRRGCKIEHQCAVDYGIPTLEYSKTKEFGKMLKERLEAEGITTKEFADRCNISEYSMERYIEGARVPRGPKLVNMAAALREEPLEMLKACKMEY